MTNEAEPVLRCQERRLAAHLAADVEALERLYHSDLLYVHTSGTSDTKVSLLQKIENCDVIYEIFEIRPEAVRIHQGTALITGKADIGYLRAGTRTRLASHIVEVWQESGGDWQMVYYQSTLLPVDQH